MLLLLVFIILVVAISTGFSLYISQLLKRENLKQQQISDLASKLTTMQDELTRSAAATHQRNELQVLAGHIISQLDQGVICIDRNRIVRLANAYAERYLNVIPAVGKPYQEVLRVLENAGKNDLSLVEAALSGESKEIPDNFMMATTRGKIPIRGTITPITTDDPTGMVVFSFADNSEYIARIMEEKAFFSAASHELRTPLTVIRLATSLLLTKMDTMGREKIIEHLTQIDKTSEQLVILVNDYLNISRIEQGRLQVEIKPFDIVALTDEVIRELSGLAKNRQLYINHEPFSVEHRMVVADRIKSKEVLTNLISNGIKYTLQGGLTITHQESTNAIATKITDTGRGIPQDYQRMLFKRFMQIDSARLQSSAKSIGLGLYISKKFAQLMRGDIVLEASEPGKGSTFTFTLPTG